MTEAAATELAKDILACTWVHPDNYETVLEAIVRRLTQIRCNRIDGQT